LDGFTLEVRSVQTDPVAVTNKWAQNLGGATTQITSGVNAVQTSPMAKAAANVNGYLAGVQAAVSSGKWVRGLNRRTLNDWQSAMIQKGVPRIATGAQTAKPKFQAFMTQWLPYEQAGLATLPARGDINANKARAAAMIDYNHAFKRQ
jgi:hypothetical protein